MKKFLFIVLFLAFSFMSHAQENAPATTLQAQTQLKVKELVEKKAEYNRLTGGEQPGYRIKIHFGTDRDAAEAVRTKFSARFPDYPTDKEYQQPYFVVLVGAYKTKLEAFESWKEIQAEFPNSFIIKSKIRVR